MKLVSELVRLSAKAALLACLLPAQASLFAQMPPAIFVKMSTSQVASGSTPTSATTTSISAPGSGWSFSAAAPIAGTTWNQILRPNPAIGSNNTSIVGQYVCNSANNIALADSSGAATNVRLTLSIDIQDLENNATRTEPNTAAGSTSATGPNALMGTAWRIYRGGNGSIHRLTGLPAGAHYFLYAYGTTTTTGQGCKFTLDPANVPAGATASFLETRGGNSGNIYTFDGTNYSLTTPAAAGVVSTAADSNSWGRIHAVVDGSGVLTFKTSKNAGNGQYYQGYQLMPYPTPVIGLQPPASASATVGGEVTLAVTASGEGAITYQWRKDGAPLADGASGSGSAYAGVNTASLTISGVSALDDGNYDVLVSNVGGATPSSATALTVTTSAIAPNIVAPPSAATATVGGSVSFSVSANGTAPLSYQWQKSLNNVDFTDIPSGTTASLSLGALTTADAGYYRVIVANSVDSVTSASAPLTIAPVIGAAPSAALVSSGASRTISVVADVGAGSPEPITYVWKRNGVTITNAGVVSGAATADLLVGSFSIAESGYYTVTVSNTAGSVTSTPVYVGLGTSQSVAYSPGNASVGVNPDAPLVIRFTAAPRVGSAGKITVRKSSDDSLVETIDLGALSVLTNGSATYRYQSKPVGGSGGNTYNYTPVVVVGNEARISLKSGTVLQYNTSYYVNLEVGAVLDSTGASVSAIADKTTWAFTTKASAPDAVPTRTTFTVAADGGGDFSTIQGALDFIPAGNTTPVRIEIEAGVYDEIINTGSRHNLTFVGEGADRTILQYTNNNVLNGGTSGRIGFFAKGNDLVFRDLALVNTTPKGGSQAEALRSDGQRVVFVGCAFKSFQDTLLLGGTSLFQDCYIEGDTDYIWGGGTAMFRNCELRCLNPAELTQARTPANRFGFIFLDCVITKPAGASFSYGLGRNSDNSNVAFIDTRMDTHISATAWSSAFGTTLRNWEYNSRNLAGTALVDVSQRVLSRQLTASEAALLRDPAVVYGTTADGSPAGAVGDGWVPSFDGPPAPTIVTPPQSRSAAAGASVTFTVSATGSAVFTYQWRKGGVPVTGQVGSSFTISPVGHGDAGSYDCVVTNSSGSTPSAAAVLAVLSPVAAWADGFGLDGTEPGFASADADGDGVANLLEYVLGGDPTAPESGLAPIVAVVEDVEGKQLVIEYVRATAAAAVTTVVETSADLATWTPRTDGVDAEIEIIPSIGQAINVDMNNAVANNYAGLAVAPGGGTVWNGVTTTAPSLVDVTDSAGVPTTVDVAVTSSGGFSAWSNTTNGTPNPALLMQDYFFGNTYTVTVGGLQAGAYLLYVYAHGDQDSQTSTITISANNGGGVKSTAGAGANTFRDAFTAGAEGVAYVKFTPTVGVAGTLQFSAGNYINGFQLVHLTDPAHERVRVTIPFTEARLFARLRATE